MAELSRDEKRKERNKQTGYTRAVRSRCPECERMNAYFKIEENELWRIKKCRYCGYSAITDMSTFRTIRIKSDGTREESQ